MSKTIADARFLAKQVHKHEEGYIIAFHHRRAYESADPQYRTLFAHWRRNGAQITGGALGNAFIFPTYQAATEAAIGWTNTNDPKANTRIIKVRTRASFEILADYPINLVDVLAEL